MSAKTKLSLAAAIILLAVWFYFTPYLAIQGLKEAARSAEASDLNEYVDFPVLRENTKQEMNALVMSSLRDRVKETDGFAAFGVALATMMIDQLVEALVTPQGIATMLEGKKPLQEGAKPPQSGDFPDSAKPTEVSFSDNPDIDTDMHYKGFDRFVVTVTNKKVPEGAFKFEMERRSLIGWKLTAIRFPKAAFAKLAKNESAAEEGVSVDIPPVWNYQDDEDRFDGRRQTVVGRLVTSESKDASLIFRKSATGFESYIITGDGYICNNDSLLAIEVAVDEGEVFTVMASNSDDNTALFLVNPEEFSERIKTGQTVYMRVKDNCGSRTDLTATMEGFSDAFSQFK